MGVDCSFEEHTAVKTAPCVKNWYFNVCALTHQHITDKLMCLRMRSSV